MRKQIALVFAALALSMAGASAHAGTHVSWSVGINVPPVATVVTSVPVAVPPAPVVYAPPVYVEEPVVYVPPPRVIYRPVPVVVRPSYYYRPAPVIYTGGHYRGGWYGDRGWNHDGGHWHDHGGQPSPMPHDDFRRRH